MKSKCRGASLLAGLALAVGALSGCQTRMAGMTLPSPDYLNHPPQYFAPSGPFPLPQELASQQREAARIAGDAGGAAVPPPAFVPPGGARPFPGGGVLSEPGGP